MIKFPYNREREIVTFLICVELLASGAVAVRGGVALVPIIIVGLLSAFLELTCRPRRRGGSAADNIT